MMRFRKTLVALLVFILLLGVAGVVGAESHQHQWSTWEVTQKATCTDSGTSKRTCSAPDCPLGGVDFDYNIPPATGHSWGPFILTQAATCTSEGVETSTCSVCSTTQTRPVAMKPHQMTGWILKKSPNCTEDGLEENDCSVCNKQKQTRVLNKLGHAWADWYVSTPATCDAPGKATRVCTRGCGVKPDERAIDKLGHLFGDWYADPPADCTTDGTLKRVCTRACGTTDSKPQTKLGHSFGNWVSVKNPTCIAEGEKSATCTRCAFVKTEKVSALGKNQPNGHKFGGWGSRVEPTCTKSGSEKRSCSDCGREETRSISMLPHTSDGIWQDEREASTKQMGLQVTHCKVCGSVASQRSVAPRGFRYEVPTYAYGPMAGEFPGGSFPLPVIYLSLTEDSDQRYALVTEDGWLVGYARVTVAGGTVRVSMEKTIESNVMRYRAWGMFPDVTMVRPVDYDSSLPFDQAVKGPGESCVIVVGMITNYYQGGANEKFSDGLMAPGSGMSYQDLNLRMLELAEQSGE